MPNTYLTAQRHVLVRQEKGKFHAGYELATPAMGFRSACGETLARATEYPATELERILTEQPESLCQRCDRVGRAIVSD